MAREVTVPDGMMSTEPTIVIDRLRHVGRERDRYKAVLVELRARLKDAEAGSTGHLQDGTYAEGIYWQSSKLVEAMRWFYETTDHIGPSSDTPNSTAQGQSL